MTELRDDNYSTYIASSVYKKLNKETKYSAKNGRNRWESWKWAATAKTLYRSSWWWKF